MNKGIIFLVSGGGGNLRFILEAQRYDLVPGKVVRVIADRNCGAINSARSRGVPSDIINYSKENPAELLLALKPYSEEIIITNIHKILSPEIILAHKGWILNLHYSILPSFSGMIGMATLQAALKAGCTVVGSTAHLVNEDLDAGPIIAQGVVPVSVLCRERLVELTFRSGCLVLLNAIRLLADQHSSLAPPMFSPEFGLLAPGSDFDLSMLDQKFWERIR